MIHVKQQQYFIADFALFCLYRAYVCLVIKHKQGVGVLENEVLSWYTKASKDKYIIKLFIFNTGLFV